MKNKCLTLFLIGGFISINIHSKANDFQGIHSVREPGFIENKGQVRDQNQKLRSDVLFIFNEGNFKWILRRDGFSYELSTLAPGNSNNNEAGSPPIDPDDLDEGSTDVEYQRFFNVEQVHFVNANKNVTVEAKEPVSYYYNYYTEYCAIPFVHLYKNIVYHDIYKDIDLSFTFIQDNSGKYHPEYNWIIHKNGNVKNIVLSYEGTNQISLREDGSLFLNGSIGFISESKPNLIFHDGHQDNNVSFTKKNQLISFSTKVPAKQDFIIDPTIEWGIYWGGNNEDLPDETAVVSRNGNDSIYMCGRTLSTNDLIYDGSGCPSTVPCPDSGDSPNCNVIAQSTFGTTARTDMFLAKFNSSSTADHDALIWETYYGGNKADIGFSLAVDPTGPFVVIAGKTFSAGLSYLAPLNYGSFHPTKGDGLLVRFNAKGERLRALYVGGNKEDHFLGVAYDRNGNIYASGYAETENSSDCSVVNIACGNAHAVEQDSCNCSITGSDEIHGDIIVVKFNNDLSSKIWGTYLGATLCDGKDGLERGHAITVDYNFNVYQVGTIGANADALHKGSGVFQKYKFSDTADDDAYLAKWDSSGHLVWLTYYGGENTERGRDVKTDDSGAVYILGHTQTTCNPCTSGGSGDCGTSAFTFSGSAGYPIASSIIKSQMAVTDTKDGFLAKFDPGTGRRIWNTYIGGDNKEHMRSLQVNPKGAPIYVGGGTSSTGLAGLDAYQNVNAGMIDFFFQKINWNASRVLYGTYYGGDGAEGDQDVGNKTWYNGVIAVNQTNGDIYISSKTTSTNSIYYSNPGADSCFQSLNPGHFDTLPPTDVFLAKFTDACGSTGQEQDAGDAFEPNNDSPPTTTTPFLPFPPHGTKGKKAYIPDVYPVTVNGLIFSTNGGTDLDFYKIRTPAMGNQLTISLTNVPGGEDYDVFLWNNSSSLIYSGNIQGSGQPESIGPVPVSKNAIYYVEVAGHTDAIDLDPSHCYTLTITPSYSRKESDPGLAENPVIECKLFPNPAQQTTELSIESEKENLYNIAVFDVLGNSVFEKNYFLNAGESKIELDLNKFVAGNYSVHIQSNEGESVLKLAVVR